MRLDIGTFPVEEIYFGSRTKWKDGVLEIDAEALLKQVLSDPRIAQAKIELANPGESVRIWPVRDVIEPRIKVKGPGIVYPGICDRSVTTVGQGVTLRLSGLGIIEVSEVLHHEVRSF
jgi:glycine reductase